MSEELKYYIDGFDIELLSESEKTTYNLLIHQGDNHRTALLRMVVNAKNKSYYLTELQEMVEEHDLNIEDYQ